MEEIRVQDWNELFETLYRGSYNPVLGRTRSPHAFRGMNEANNRLTTSLHRLGGEYARLERHLLRNFRKYAPQAAVQEDTVWNWMALGQHHGLPTRLLDWTFSPQVAMHFATADLEQFGRDGVIWSIDFVQAHTLIPDTLRDEIHEEGSDVFTVEMLQHRATSLGAFSRLADEDFLVFFEPPSMDERIVNQFALFSVMSRATGSMEDWIAAHPQLVRKVVIPAGLKWEIRDKLDQANVTERVLLPGLEGLSAWLRRYYTPRTP
jgi:hypothetical protein